MDSDKIHKESISKMSGKTATDNKQRWKRQRRKRRQRRLGYGITRCFFEVGTIVSQAQIASKFWALTWHVVDDPQQDVFYGNCKAQPTSCTDRTLGLFECSFAPWRSRVKCHSWKTLAVAWSRKSVVWSLESVLWSLKVWCNHSKMWCDHS